MIVINSLVFGAKPVLTHHSKQNVPLSLDKMWELLQTLRGFESAPGSKADKLRQQPATIAIDPKGKGPAIGPGYQTFSVIQVVSADGRTSIVSYSVFEGGSSDHAEAQSIRRLEAEIAKQTSGKRMLGGKLIAIVDQDVCGACQQRLEAFAKSHGMISVEAYVPHRSSLSNPARLVSPKTAMRSSFGRLLDRNGQPVGVRFRKSFSLKLEMPKISLSTNSIRIRAVGRYFGKSIGMAALGVLFGWLRQKMDQEITGRQIKYLAPKIEQEIRRQSQKVLALAGQGKKAYANVTVEIETRTTPEPDGFMFTDFPTVELKSVNVTEHDRTVDGGERTRREFPITFRTVTYTFSIEIDLEQ